MKKLLPIAPLLFLALASAGPPPPSGPGPMAGEGTGYPPCSRTVRDRCIQLHERGVATPHNLAVNNGDARPAHRSHSPVQLSGGDYPPCTASRQDSCTQGAGTRRAAPVRYASAPVRYAMTERQRIRIGERG